MRLTTLCSTLFAIATTSWGQVTPAVPPTFKPLFVGTLIAGESGTVNGPYGIRLLGPITGGNLTDVSGNLVATVLSAADTGIISHTGIFYPEVVLSLRWEKDQKFAYLNAMGVGKLHAPVMTYLHLETDSEAYHDLNSKFLLAQVDVECSGNSLALTIFGA